MFVLQNQADVVDGESGRQPEIDNPVSRFDLTMSASEYENSLGFTVEYSAGLFAAETVRRLTALFQTLVNRVVGDPESPLKDLSLLDEAGKAMILNTFNDTATEFPRNAMVH